MATLAQLRSRVSAKLGLDATAAGADETLVDGWLNEGVVDVLLQTGCKVTTGTVNLTAGTSDYTLDATVLLIKDAYTTSSGETYRLRQVSAPELIDMRVTDATSDSPSLYYALYGADLFMVYPTPAAADTVTLYHVPKPTVMSTGTHDPSNATYGGVPTEFHKAIEYYALAQGADYQNDETSAQGERYRSMYENELKRVRKLVNVKANVRVPVATVGRSRRVPRRNDIY